MRVLIAGCGYVGLPLGAALSAAGHEVFGLRRSARATEELEAAGIVPLRGDLTDPTTLSALPSPFDWVVNCAASGGGSGEDYQRLYVQGNANLAARLAARPPSRFIYTSSTGVYGQEDGAAVDETSATTPASATGRTLVEAESALHELHRQRGLPVIVLRLAGIYGPGRGYWIRQFLAGAARVEGEGQRVLNMIHREDVVGAVLHALEHAAAGETYNVVDDEPVAQIELFRWLAARLDRPMPPPTDAGGAPTKRAGTSKRVSNRKLRQLGWQLRFPTFREGMAALLAGE